MVAVSGGAVLRDLSPAESTGTAVWLAKRSVKSSRWLAPTASGVRIRRRRTGQPTPDGWNSRSTAVSAGDTCCTGRRVDPVGMLLLRDFTDWGHGAMAWSASSLWWNPRERRGPTGRTAGRGARLTRRVREEYLVYFDRNATMRAAKRSVSGGMHRPSNAARVSPQAANVRVRSGGPMSPSDARGAKASSSIGRAPVSKTGGWGFDPLLACHPDVHRQPDDGRRGS